MSRNKREGAYAGKHATYFYGKRTTRHQRSGGPSELNWINTGPMSLKYWANMAKRFNYYHVFIEESK